MDADRIAIAKACLYAAHDGSLSFPQIVGRLIDAGFEGYALDFRRNSQTFYLPDGDNVAMPTLPDSQPIASRFDAFEVAAMVRWAQENPPDYSFVAFCQRVKAAGCAGYMVSFPGRRVVYYGRTAETHVEYFPS